MDRGVSKTIRGEALSKALVEVLMRVEPGTAA
jgi:hypothetical protein